MSDIQRPIDMAADHVREHLPGIPVYVHGGGSQRSPLVEFLTARLDEDEAEVEGDPYEARYRNLQFGLADIAAKRRMLERAWLSIQYLPPEMRTPAKDAAAYDAFWVLAELASPYSDHPDYRQEWRP